MCGACGRAVAADPVFPSGRTTRGSLVVAGILQGLCPQPGTVRITAHASGWSVRSAGGRHRVCATVTEIWDELLAVFPALPEALDAASGGLAQRYDDPGDRALLERVLDLGRDLRQT
ncbi:hypothetical protein GCM10028789_07450 [Sinomonas halotolerans]